MILTLCCKCIFQCLLSPLMVGWWYITAVATCVRSQKMVVSSTPLELPSARKPIFANFIMYLILGRAWLIFAFIRHIILIYIHSYPLIHIFICNNLLWYVFPFLLFFDVRCYFPLLAFLPKHFKYCDTSVHSWAIFGDMEHWWKSNHCLIHHDGNGNLGNDGKPYISL